MKKLKFETNISTVEMPIPKTVELQQQIKHLTIENEILKNGKVSWLDETGHTSIVDVVEALRSLQAENYNLKTRLRVYEPPEGETFWGSF